MYNAYRQKLERTLNPVSIFTLLFAQRSDARSDRYLVLSAVEKQWSLSFSGSVAFNLRLARRHWEKDWDGRERKAGGKRRGRERESQWFPPAPVSIVSPVAHLTHSLCWAMGKSDWAHYPLLRTDTGSARRARERGCSPAYCEWTPSPVLSLSGVYGHLPTLSLSNLALRRLPAFVQWKQMSAVSSHRVLVQWGMDVASWDYWHALCHPLSRLVNKKGWMTDTVKGM